jgi:hypothetical protein
MVTSGGCGVPKGRNPTTAARDVPAASAFSLDARDGLLLGRGIFTAHNGRPLPPGRPNAIGHTAAAKNIPDRRRVIIGAARKPRLVVAERLDLQVVPLLLPLLFAVESESRSERLLVGVPNPRKELPDDLLARRSQVESTI